MNLPYISKDLPGIGGELKTTPQFFKVTEIPQYLPSGEGQHIYINITRESLSTKEVITSLCELFKISDKDIGTAGLKDKHAQTTQWISISLGANASLEETKALIQKELPALKINLIDRHINKLKTGHLLGNQFEIIISDVAEMALEKTNLIHTLLSKTGIPNFYGPQRFGSKGDNAKAGKLILTGEKKCKRHWMKKLYLSAYQSLLFNKWLTQRIEREDFSNIIEGDSLVKIGGGRSFLFDTEREHLAEFERNEITYTGPIFGHKVNLPLGKALEYEQEIFNSENIDMSEYKKNKLFGTRREAKIFPKDFLFRPVEEGILFSFSLSSGCYATSVLREFMKNDVQ